MLGIFDSGSGGLTVLKEIKHSAPNLNIVYFADFKNVPYGNKTPEELRVLTVSAIDRLLVAGADNIVSACNSVSSSSIKPFTELLHKKDFGLVGMVSPTIRELVPEAEKGKRILLVATEATVQSGIYTHGFAKENISIQSLAIPQLVPAIEGEFPKQEIQNIISDALKEIHSFDILLLGCTHYPLVQDIFEDILMSQGRKASVFNPAGVVSREAIDRFHKDEHGELTFLLSAPSPSFEKRARALLGEETNFALHYT
ncbi:MAG TPA: glutamate racemase [Candidatus Paceibacterota bacterium]